MRMDTPTSSPPSSMERCALAQSMKDYYAPANIQGLQKSHMYLRPNILRLDRKLTPEERKRLSRRAPSLVKIKIIRGKRRVKLGLYYYEIKEVCL